MSSVAVRTTFKNFLTANAPTENLIDMSGHYEDVEDLLDQSGVGMGDPWIGLNFIPSDEIGITVPATNDSGKYRESGIIQVHVVDIAKLAVSDSILARCETLRNLLRGRRITDLKIEGVTPPSFEAGTTLEFEAGFISATFIVTYELDFDL